MELCRPSFLIRGNRVDRCRLLNDNLLSGEVPPELGALPIRGAVLKYVYVHLVKPCDYPCCKHKLN